MTYLKITNDQIIDGRLPEIPEGTTELVIDDCADLELISKFPATLKQININRCLKLRALPPFPEGIEEISLRWCVNLWRIENFPASLKKLKIDLCLDLRSLPPFKEGLINLNLIDCSKLEIGSFPESLIEARIINCLGLKTLPPFKEGITLLDLRNCENLQVINNLPKSLKRLVLESCKNLIEELSEDRLGELEMLGCKVTYPEHFRVHKSAQKEREKLNGLVEKYNETNGDSPRCFDSIKQLLHLYLAKGLVKFGDIKTITFEVGQILNFLKKEPRILPIVNDVASQYLEACVNQPVRGWSEISALVAIAEKETILDKIEAARQLKTLDVIASFIGRLPADKKPGSAVEVEAGNALLREVHKKLLDEKVLPRSWLGVPELIAYESSIAGWLEKDLIESAVNKVKEEVFFNKSLEGIAEYLCETQHQEAWGEICFPEKIAEIKNSFADSMSDLRDEEEIKKLGAERDQVLATSIKDMTLQSLKTEMRKRIAISTSANSVPIEEDEIPITNPQIKGNQTSTNLVSSSSQEKNEEKSLG